MNLSMPLSLALSSAILTGMTASQAAADPPDISGQAGSDAYEIVGEMANEGSHTPGIGTAAEATTGAEDEPAFVEYKWASVCSSPGAPGGTTTEMDCNAARVCADPGERLYRLWGLSQETSAWVPLATQCFGERPTVPDAPAPEVTPAMVLNEIRRIGLPALEALTQPEGKTLVHFDTIFYAEAQPFIATVTLLGQQVDIEAEPSRYTWHHGDGTTAVTSTPGAPYPAKDVVHQYATSSTVRPRVDVTYTARFRVNGGAWQDIDEAVTMTGPEGSLQVAEAAATLSGNYG